MRPADAFARWFKRWSRERIFPPSEWQMAPAFLAGWRAAQRAARQAEAQSRRECSAAEVEAAETGGERAG